MTPLPIITDSFDRTRPIARQLAGVLEARFYPPDRLVDAAPAQFPIVDINLKDGARLPALRDWLHREPKSYKAIFVANKGLRVEEVRAYATGATTLVYLPIDVKTLLTKHWGDFSSLTDDQLDFAAENSTGAAAAQTALQNIFPAPVWDSRLI